jgi:hypothetical protein
MIGGEVRADPGSAAARTHTRPNLRLELRAPLGPLYDPRIGVALGARSAHRFSPLAK